MKIIKIIILGTIIGVGIGMWLGVNIGREMPLLSNPFYKEPLQEKIKRHGGEMLKKTGRAIEKAGQGQQNNLNPNN